MPKLGLGSGHNRRLDSYMGTLGVGDPGLAGMAGRALHWDSPKPLPIPHPPQFADRRPGLAVKAKLAWLLAFVRTSGKGVEHKLSSLIQKPGKGEGLVSFSSLEPELEEGRTSILPEFVGVTEDLPVISTHFMDSGRMAPPVIVGREGASLFCTKHEKMGVCRKRRLTIFTKQLQNIFCWQRTILRNGTQGGGN